MLCLLGEYKRNEEFVFDKKIIIKQLIMFQLPPWFPPEVILLVMGVALMLQIGMYIYFSCIFNKNLKIYILNKSQIIQFRDYLDYYTTFVVENRDKFNFNFTIHSFLVKKGKFTTAGVP